MRSLIVIGLSVSVATAATAQTELIIRRPGHSDQVIQLADSARTARIGTRLDSSLRIMLGARNSAEADRVIAGRFQDLQREIAGVRIDSLRSQMLALQIPQLELAARNGVQELTSRIGALPAQPHFGIAVDYRPRDSDRWGAYVMAVTPGSPAAQAGILSGDIITRIAGKSLVDKERKGATAADDQSLPYVRMTMLISQLEVGKPVAVELRRGNQTHTVHVTPDESDTMQPAIAQREPFTTLFAPRSDVASTISIPTMAPDMQSISVFSNSDGGDNGFGYAYGPVRLFSDVEFAPMNEKLGAYFGVSEGVLVVDTRPSPRTWNDGRDTVYEISQNAIKLEPGDVITAVDGRQVRTPSQLMRIVASYDRGEEFKLQVMRQKHTQTIPVKMP